MNALAPHAGRMRKLFEPAAAGEWTLPSDMVRLYRAVARLNDALGMLTMPEEPFDQLVEAATQSKSPHALDVSALVDFDRAVREYEVRGDVLRKALKQVDDQLATAVIGGRDRIITEHLAPAGVALWQEVTEAVRDLEGAPAAGADAIQGSSDRARAAYAKLDDTTGCARRYGNLRAAWGLIVGPAAELDYDNHHGEFSAGLCQIWPERSRGWLSDRGRWPWGDDARDRLVWLVRHDITPWFPTRAQQDSAWSSAHGDRAGAGGHLRVHVTEAEAVW